MNSGKVFATVWMAITLTVSLGAAEKDRPWQMGQLAPSKSSDAHIQYIASADKTYIVRGDDLGFAVGDPVRFAVQDKTMYISLEGREYKLAILGATVRLNAAPVSPSAPAPPPAPAATAPPPPPAPAATAPANDPGFAPLGPVVTPALSMQPATAGLDNDAVVKMILGGLKDDTVIQVIRSRPASFNLTPASLGALKAAGVSQSVIAAMTAKMNSQAKQR